MAIGSVWPKNYTAFTIIHIDESNILQPLMRGAAETTEPNDHVANAREIIFGEVIMHQVLTDAGWLESNPSEVDQERLKNDIKKSVSINAVGENLLRIEYVDNEPLRAFTTAKRLAELFIEEGEKTKVQESQSAYNFIDKQVSEYLKKLTKVEEELRAFRSNNPDARPGLENEVSQRITELHQNIEEAKLQLQETVIKRDSMQQQLSGEAAITISQTRETQYRNRIAEAQGQLELLRLDYKETYPDIIRLKHQIEDMKESLRIEIQSREDAKRQAQRTGQMYLDESIMLSPLYQELRSNLSETETEIATLKARINELNKMLENEYARSKKIYGGEATLSKLTRDYQVNQEIYQDLLRRLENARVSKNLDEEQQGLTYRIQEPAKLPLLPTGVRFLHFAIIGLVLGVAVPVGLVYMLIQVDPRVRFSQVIKDDLDLPLLAEITSLQSISDRREEKINLIKIAIGVFVVFLVYAYAGWLRMTGKL